VAVARSVDSRTIDLEAGSSTGYRYAGDRPIPGHFFLVPQEAGVPRVYVGNLAESVTRDDLRALFSKIGKVGGALVITDPATGRSRGFGFVEMIDVDDAINAAVYFSGAELEGRKLQVDQYRAHEAPGSKMRGERKRRAPVKRASSNGSARA
jgi:RNA recognition motif-containing protein